MKVDRNDLNVCVSAQRGTLTPNIFLNLDSELYSDVDVKKKKKKM